MGRPNVGKSTLINALFGKHCSLVSATAGTTRDPVWTSGIFNGRQVQIVDSAGLALLQVARRQVILLCRVSGVSSSFAPWPTCKPCVVYAMPRSDAKWTLQGPC